MKTSIEPMSARDNEELPLSRRHVPALDGLRGVAILGVLFYHFAFSMAGRGPVDATAKVLLRSGWLGVDLFFVLSGFLITGILIDARGSEGYFRTFFARRSLRIFPLYFLSVGALVFALHVAIPALTGRATPPGAVWPLWTYLTNFAVAMRGDWSAVPFYGIHFWSLAIEEQFYLAWPIVVYLCTPRTLLRVCISAIVGSVLIRLAMFAFDVPAVALYVLPFTRLDSLGCGALLAVAARDARLASTIRPMLRGAAPVAVAALVLFTLWRGQLENLDPVALVVALPLAAVVAAHVVLARFERAGSNDLADRMLSSRPLRMFGRYSYALYVIHYPLRAIFDPLSARYLQFTVLGSELPARTLYFALAIGTSLALAWLSWHVVERPFLRLKDRVHPRSDRQAAAMPSGAVATIP